MKWVRCPSCRTEHDVDRYPQCDGCNRDLTGVAPIDAPAAATTVQRTELDSRSGGRALLVIALLSLVGTFLLPPGVTVLTALLSLVLLAVVFMRFGLRRVWEARTGPFAKALGTLLAIAMALGGAALLVFIACTVNLRGFRIGG